MRHLLLSAVLLLSTASTQAMEFPEEVIQYVDNARIVAFMRTGEFAHMPSWQPLENEPPLTLSKALSTVKARIAKEERLTGAELKSIKLQEIPHHASAWNYIAKLLVTRDEHVEDHYVLVLMNGDVIDGMREPDSLK